LIPKTKDRATKLMCTILQTIIYNNYQIVNITYTFKKTTEDNTITTWMMNLCHITNISCMNMTGSIHDDMSWNVVFVNTSEVCINQQSCWIEKKFKE